MGRRRTKRYNITIDVPSGEFFVPMAEWIKDNGDVTVQNSASRAAAIARSLAPKLYGFLRSGIVPTDEPERSAATGKLVYNAVMDAAMNDTFAKYTKTGKRIRYYYPASQEMGFRTRAKPGSHAKKRVPGKYFLKMAAERNYGEHMEDISAAVDDILKEVSRDDP